MRNESYSRSELQNLSEALNSLDSVARKGSSELSKAIRKDYRNLRKSIEGFSPEVKRAMKEVQEEGRQWWEDSKEWVGESRERAVEWSKDSWKEVDDSAKHHPWSFMGGTFALGAIVGYFFSRR